MRHYPLVGLVLGALTAGVYFLFSRWTPSMAAVSLAVVSLVLFSGALHLDGLADMCDGFYKGKTKEEILAVMKDSHSGAMAVVGIACLFTVKLSLLWSLPPGFIVRTLVLMPMAGRWSMTLLAASSSYARPEGGTAKSYVDHAGRTEAVVSSLISVAAGAVFMGLRGLAALAATALFVWGFRKYALRKIDGVTGDVLGACGESAECVFLLGVAAGAGGAA